MKNKKLYIASGLFLLSISTLLTACSDNGNTEIVSKNNEENTKQEIVDIDGNDSYISSNTTINEQNDVSIPIIENTNTNDIIEPTTTIENINENENVTIIPTQTVTNNSSVTSTPITTVQPTPIVTKPLTVTPILVKITNTPTPTPTNKPAKVTPIITTPIPITPTPTSVVTPTPLPTIAGVPVYSEKCTVVSVSSDNKYVEILNDKNQYRVYEISNTSLASELKTHISDVIEIVASDYISVGQKSNNVVTSVESCEREHDLPFMGTPIYADIVNSISIDESSHKATIYSPDGNKTLYITQYAIDEYKTLSKQPYIYAYLVSIENYPYSEIITNVLVHSVSSPQPQPSPIPDIGPALVAYKCNFVSFDENTHKVTFLIDGNQKSYAYSSNRDDITNLCKTLAPNANVTVSIEAHPDFIAEVGSSEKIYELSID